VAFVWAGVSVILPFIASKVAISPDVFLTFFQRILIVVALILPFEIRDVPYDGLNLKTLPQQLGVKNTKLLGQIILLLCLVFEFFKVYSEVPYLISLLIFCVVLGWLLVISKTQQTRYFASFLVEGLPIMWLLLYLLFEQF
jgi:4-hydroxybenzoate polyprenyltransferase